MIPIIIITVTGVYLSLEKFSLLPKDTSVHINIEQKKDTLISNFDFFKTTRLEEVKKIEFPFSTDEEDYYYVKLTNKEVAVHQKTGQIISMPKPTLSTSNLSILCFPN